MKKLLMVLVLGGLVLVGGCAVGRSPVNNGFIFTSVDGSESISANPIGTKSGEACATNIFGMFAFGNASAAKAAQSGGITKIAVVDYSTSGFLGIFATSCTVVRGE